MNLQTDILIRHALQMNACLFLSGGQESLLLLHLLRQTANIPVITFAEDWTKEQLKQLEKIVLDYDLTLYTYPSANRYFLPNGDGFSLVDEYGFGGNLIPVVRDIEDAETGCLADIETRRLDMFDFGFDCVLTGFLKEDNHALIGNPMGEVKEQGTITFIAPLWNWTKAEISAEIERLNLHVIEKSGDLRSCAKCLGAEKEVFCHKENKMIPTIEWSPQENLEIFREKFGYV